VTLVVSFISQTSRQTFWQLESHPQRSQRKPFQVATAGTVSIASAAKIT
jgi:hypothetical protein